MRRVRWMVLLLSLAGTLAYAAQESGDAAKGATKVGQCMGCHGIDNYQASFPEVYRVPKIAGQNQEYLISALNDYRKGLRKHPTMRATATALSTKDIADIAAFYSQGAK